MGPDTVRHTAPSTFGDRHDAEDWLRTEMRLLAGGSWTPPAGRPKRPPVTLGEYAARWLVDRPLKPRTRHHYARMLENHIKPTFGAVPLGAITPRDVRVWHDTLGADTPTVRAHAYGLLRGILQGAVQDGEIAANPAHIRGASNARRVHEVRPASLPELEALTAALPRRYQLMVLLAAWCGLPFGQLTELRRKDIDTENAVIHVRRAVIRVNGEFVVDTATTGRATRDVRLPPQLLPMVQHHLSGDVVGGPNGLLFPAGDGHRHLSPSTFYKAYYPARAVAGRPDLRFQDLRHTGALLAASTGDTLAGLMGRLGQSPGRSGAPYTGPAPRATVPAS